jgi:hypothetical protein
MNLIIFEKITNHNYKFNDAITNKSKFNKINKEKILKIKETMTKVEISVNKKTILVF